MLFDCHRCGKIVDSSEVRCIQGAVSGFYRHLECGGLAIERDDRLSALETRGDTQFADNDKEPSSINESAKAKERTNKSEEVTYDKS